MSVMSLLVLLLLLLLYKYKQVSWAAELGQEPEGARCGWPLLMVAHSDRLSCN
jgi:ribosomal protein S27AE